MDTKNEYLRMTILISSIICLIISVRLFWNMCIYADEHGTGPNVMCGGNFWLYMNWLRLALVLIMCILSMMNLFHVKILSIICLIISVILFWNMGVFADKYNTSLAAVYGGDFWLYMNWLRLGLLSMICILCEVDRFYERRNKESIK